MKQTISALGTATLLAFAVSAGAQSTTTTSQQKANRWDTKEITVAGCVEKNKSGGHFLTHAMMSPAAASAPTGTSGSSTTTTSDRSTTNKSDSMTMMTWNLENGKDLDQHVGHKVEVTGHAEMSTSGDQLKGTTGDKEIEARDIDVKSIKMIAASCQ